MSSPIFIPCILGPTGAGKTAAALALAEAFPCSVINADSRQTYRDFPVITAQPTPEDREQCPHLLYGYLDVQEKLGAGEYARIAADTIAAVDIEQRIPVLVGGTGLYFRALLEGIAPIPQVPHEVFRMWQRRCNVEGSQALHLLLAEVDSVYAAKIHPHDRQRVCRALEVWQSTGKNFTWWHKRPVPPSTYRALKVGVGLPLAELEPRLLRRIDQMLEKGAVAEAEEALARCPDPAAPGWSGIGCRELFQYCIGAITFDRCRKLWLHNTRAYAKRQLTWFKADSDVRWFAPWQVEEIVEYCRRMNRA